jgi:hypothetical protein
VSFEQVLSTIVEWWNDLQLTGSQGGLIAAVGANLVAGIVITCTRAFRVGDRVRIVDTEASVEIASPRYSAIRDGGRAAIPDKYPPQEYEPPPFRIRPWENIVRKKPPGE